MRATLTTPPALAAGPPSPPSRWRRLGRYRVLGAGLLACALAGGGEALMRAERGHAGLGTTIGGGLLALAVLLVGCVAWVGAGERLAPAGPGGAAAPAGGPAARARLGRRGTLAGLALVGALAAGCYTLLQPDFRNPLAPWLWVVMLLTLAGTFAGVAAAPAGLGLVPHDPAEPASAPPVSRAEWLALAALLLLAAALRLWDLEQVPIGPYLDEGGRALNAREINEGLLVNGQPFAFFGTAWFGVPSAYFWLVAQSMRLFGDTLAGARVVHALAGIATVAVTYRIGRRVWSPRAGLLAAALLTVSDFAIQFSRTAGESTITLLTWALCFYYLYKGLQTRRPLDFVLSGIWAGLTLYGYVAGKLLPLFLVGVAAYLLLRWGRRGARRYLPGLALLALAAGLTYAPNGLYVLTAPGAVTMRYDQVSIFTHWKEVRHAYLTTDPVRVLAGQFAVTYAAFDTGAEQGPFYPTRQPILPVAWAALWVLGSAYVVWRAGDVRYALLALWVRSGLAGAALTIHTPTVQRVAGMLPTLALVPALYLDRILPRLPPWRPGARLWSRRLAGPLALHGAAVALLVLLALQTLSYYFGDYVPQQRYFQNSLPGRYAERLDPRRDTVYQLGLPADFWNIDPALFLARGVPGRDLANPSAELPLTLPAGLNAHFLNYPSNAEYLPILRAYYPDGTATPLPRPDGQPYVTAYRVDAAAIAARRQMTARYTPARGAPVSRPAARLGTAAGGGPPQAPPSGLAFPVAAAWAGDLVAPAYGTYRLQLLAPAGATLTLDGQALLAVPPDQSAPVEAALVLSKGLHAVTLAGTLRAPTDPIALCWAAGAGPCLPPAGRFLWAEPLGTLQGRWFAAPFDPARFTTAAPALPGPAPVAALRAGLLGWRSIGPAPGTGPPAFSLWQGTLHAPVAGSYRFDVDTGGAVSLWLDGQYVGAQGVPGVPENLAATVSLTAGDHALEVRFQARQPDTIFQVYWQPPGGPQELLPPDALAPAPGGAWSAATFAPVPPPDAALLAAP